MSPIQPLSRGGRMASQLAGKEVKSTEVTFITSALNGVSTKLYNRTTTQTGYLFQPCATFEEHCGSHQPLDSHVPVFLFAGGTGITHDVAHITALLGRLCHQQYGNKTSGLDLGGP